MKNSWLFIYSGLILVLLAVFMPSSIMVEPLTSSSDYLESIPHIIISDFVFIKPTSSLLVYTLGLITIFIGVIFLNRKNTPRTLWGWSLILWGIGTLLAGTSYQAFGYELKCANQEYCSFTSWWELAYLYITGLSIGFMTASVLYYVYKMKYVILPIFASAAYGIILLLGSVMEIKLLITYEFFLLYFFWFFLLMFTINFIQYKKTKELYHYKLLRIWVMMLVINIIYFAYLFSGIAEWLWIRDIWFSANDVLHIGIIIWMITIWKSFGNEMK